MEIEIPLLKDIAVIFSLAVIVLLFCNQLRIPSIVGFLLTGILAGPHGFKLIKAVSDVDTLSKIGIMLLLFTIGLEFSLTRLLNIKRYFLMGGALQVFLTVIFGFLIAKFASRPNEEAIFLGFLLSMSSTAIVLKSLEASDETDSPHGRLSLGILIFQDVIAVPMILLTPILGNSNQTFDSSLLIRLFFGLLMIAFVFFAAIKMIPTVLYHIAKVRSRELFSLSVLTICFAVAWLASSVGLSLAIGAFLAGLIISESDYRHEAIGNILPLQDVFASLFFVSIGMLLDLKFVWEQPWTIVFLTIGVIAMKASIIAVTAFLMGLPLRVMLLAGLALSQIGEFSFVLVHSGMEYGLANEYLYQLFLAVALLTMAITPSLISYSNDIINLLLRLPFPEHWKSGLKKHAESSHHKYENHIIIIGFGIAGRSLAHAAKEHHINYVVLEMNPDTVRKEKSQGIPIYFGDATHESVLHNVHVHNAKAIAIMINDSHAAKRTVVLARKLNPSAYIIVRCRYIQEVKTMRNLGADDVIPDEFGTSIEMFTRVLQRYAIEREEIDKIVDGLRSKEKEFKIQLAN